MTHWNYSTLAYLPLLLPKHQVLLNLFFLQFVKIFVKKSFHNNGLLLLFFLSRCCQQQMFSSFTFGCLAVPLSIEIGQSFFFFLVAFQLEIFVYEENGWQCQREMISASRCNFDIVIWQFTQFTFCLSVLLSLCPGLVVNLERNALYKLTVIMDIIFFSPP